MSLKIHTMNKEFTAQVSNMPTIDARGTGGRNKKFYDHRNGKQVVHTFCYNSGYPTIQHYNLQF